MTYFGRLYPNDRKNSHFNKVKMADCRHFEKPLNRHSSATVRRIAMVFPTMTHFVPLKPANDQNFDFLKQSNMADGRRFEKSKKFIVIVTDALIKLEALGQCIPPPRYVLPVSRYQTRCLSWAGDVMTS